MRCPYCNGPDTRVLDSRQTEDGYVVRRRRVCDSCERRFTTYETAEVSIMMVVKKDGRREAFDRVKVKNGLIRACEKRPVSMDRIEEVANEIEQKIYALGEKEVKSEYVGELVMNALRDLDQVAYIRFASVYREFANVEKFAEEIDKLREQNSHHRQDATIRIALDGPSGAGKSTVAKKVAQALGFDYIDTGAMYRAVGYKMRNTGVRASDEAALAAMLAETTIDFREKKVYLDGEDVSARIRTEEISKAASECAAIPAVRTKLVEIQRDIGRRKNSVMDGRDIGTNVFPDAQYKFFLTAKPEERALRRFKELQAKGETCSYEEVLQDVKDRDYRDTHRSTDPLKKAKDAIEIDSTEMTEDEVVETILSQVSQ